MHDELKMLLREVFAFWGKSEEGHGTHPGVVSDYEQRVMALLAADREVRESARVHIIHVAPDLHPIL